MPDSTPTSRPKHPTTATHLSDGQPCLVRQAATAADVQRYQAGIPAAVPAAAAATAASAAAAAARIAAAGDSFHAVAAGQHGAATEDSQMAQPSVCEVVAPPHAKLPVVVQRVTREPSSSAMMTPASPHVHDW